MADQLSDKSIRDLYDAFNRRDSSFVTDRMSPTATWPRAFKGGFVEGPEAVRSYWEDQWKEIDPHVEPTHIDRRPDGTFNVTVHQVVRDLSGDVVSDSVVNHIYTFDGPKIASMKLAPGQ